MKSKKHYEYGFYILTPDCRVYSGLRKGYPYFSSDFNEARKLLNDEQFNIIQRGTPLKLVKEWE